MSEWLYEPAETPKWRHHWQHDVPGHLQVGDALVGKCPSSVSVELAQTLLNQGIEWRPRGWSEDYPKRIFVVYNGTVYRSTPTNPGTSYHGFPEMIERLPADPALRQRIRECAWEAGCGQEVEKWMRSKQTIARSM